MRLLFRSWIKWTWKGILIHLTNLMAALFGAPFFLAAAWINEGRTDLEDSALALNTILLMSQIVLSTFGLAVFARVYYRIYPELLEGKRDTVDDGGEQDVGDNPIYAPGKER